MVTGESIKRNKPNPDIYQLASLSMGLPPQECLVIEDAITVYVLESKQDVQSAQLPPHSPCLNLLKQVQTMYSQAWMPLRIFRAVKSLR